MQPVIRDASQEDAGAIAYLAHLAGQGNARISTYDLMMPGRQGPTPDRIYMIRRVVAANAVCMLHYSNHRVAAVDGRVAACVGAVDASGAGLISFVAALKETGWTDEEIAAMRSGVASYSPVEPPVSAGAVALENVATLPEYRRRGLAYTLVERTLEAAREGGYERAQLACHMGNAAAFHMYEKLGFKVDAARTDLEFESLFGCPGMLEMSIAL
jgi:ribosomal protein S18 acetylase RimI-like enzyme